MDKIILDSRDVLLKTLDGLNAKKDHTPDEICTMGEMIDGLKDIQEMERKEAEGYAQRMMPMNSYDPYMASFRGNVYGGYGDMPYNGNSYNNSYNSYARGNSSRGSGRGYSGNYEDERDMMQRMRMQMDNN